MFTDRVYGVMILCGRALFAALRLRRTVIGAENLDVAADSAAAGGGAGRGGAVLAITHFSYLDFALTEWALWRRNGRHARFLATARAFEHPLAGPLLRAMGHVPVERAAGAPSYAEAVRRLRSGEIVGVFPEGQVYRDDVGPLRTGAVRMAAEAGVPLIPVVVWGGQSILTKGRRPRLRRAIGARIVVLVGAPRHPQGEPGAVTADLRAELGVLTARARSLMAGET